MASDTVMQIKLEMRFEGSSKIYDTVVIDEEILPGDSIRFLYKSKKLTINPYDVKGYFLTTVNFKNLTTINNDVVGNFEHAGYFSKRNNYGINLVFIGDEKLLLCSKFKADASLPEEPLVKMSPCNLDLLKSE
jgi:hypothetical protein